MNDEIYSTYLLKYSEFIKTNNSELIHYKFFNYIHKNIYKHIIFIWFYK